MELVLEYLELINQSIYWAYVFMGVILFILLLLLIANLLKLFLALKEIATIGTAISAHTLRINESLRNIHSSLEREKFKIDGLVANYTSFMNIKNKGLSYLKKFSKKKEDFGSLETYPSKYIGNLDN